MESIILHIMLMNYFSKYTPRHIFFGPNKHYIGSEIKTTDKPKGAQHANHHT